MLRYPIPMYFSFPLPKMEILYLLDYGAGNVLSLVNAVNKLGYTIKTIQKPSDFAIAQVYTNSYELTPKKIEINIPGSRIIRCSNAKINRKGLH